MAYVQPQNRNNRAAIFSGVALLHGALGYLLVTGLGVAWVDQVRTVMKAKNTPVEQPPLPPPPPVDEMVKPAETTPLAPTTMIDVNRKPSEVVTTTISLPVDPTPAPRETAGPTPLPSPSPLFTPRVAVPRGAPGLWVTTDDYPSAALRQERAGVTRFRVTVGTDGRVAGCEIVGSSGSPDLDAATCRLIAKRARFEPASDGSGAKVAGSYSSSVKWVIPK